MPEPYKPFRTDRPPGMGPDAVATVVKGHTMGPIVDGSLVYFENEETPPSSALFGKLCVCAIPMGTRYVRFLQAGTKDGLYDLISVAGETVKDTPLHWAEPVKWIKLPE